MTILLSIRHKCVVNDKDRNADDQQGDDMAEIDTHAGEECDKETRERSMNFAIRADTDFMTLLRMATIITATTITTTTPTTTPKMMMTTKEVKMMIGYLLRIM